MLRAGVVSAKLTAKWFVFSGEEVETSSSRRHVAPVAELTAVPSLAVTGEALAALELLVRLAGEGGELTLRGDGVREELVGSSVVTEISVALTLVLGSVGCNSQLED